MRFVRLATKYQEQNILLCEINSQLFFKCCKLIGPKTELRVGYSKEYATKYHLNQLVSEQLDKRIKYLCKKCDERFVSREKLQIHLNEHKIRDAKIPPVPRTTPTKNSDTNSPNKGKDRLNTGAIRMRKLALSKNSRASDGPTVRYACCYCTKVFSKFLSYKKHTHTTHSVNIEHKRVKVDAQHKRLTIEDSVSKNESTKEDKHDDNESENDNDNGNKNKNVNTRQWFVCQNCQRHFLTSKKLEVKLPCGIQIADDF